LTIFAACATFFNLNSRRENLKEVNGALILDCNAVLLKMTEAMAESSHSISFGAS
jgi:allantoin racemase